MLRVTQLVSPRQAVTHERNRVPPELFGGRPVLSDESGIGKRMQC